ncbi:MAG: hypothetical protein WCF36_01205 [Candidatus Nanopelagicales bacterium]
MQIHEAQQDVRLVYVGGFFGQLVAGGLWLIAAAVGTFSAPVVAIAILLLGGILIFPVTMLCLRMVGRPASLPAGHPMAGLATQIAFTFPLGLLVALAVTGYRLDWFFAAAMVIVGAHYLPFVFLYGMRIYAVLAGILALGGVGLALWGPRLFSLGAWSTGLVLVTFAFLLRSAVRTEVATSAQVAPPDHTR